ncbi:hypothetical protein [Rhizobium sp. NFR03]|uniref:hypothetical protein n=1 Tax=Rhizobium sp. NFR03 TaxID=1566263 RepID=UPI001480D1FD|nr:hypothetical protein [Rhizobium sp. NFR03]
MSEEKRKRRPKGVAALGNVAQTKIAVEAMLKDEVEARKKKSERLRELRLGHSTSAG